MLYQSLQALRNACNLHKLTKEILRSTKKGQKKKSENIRYLLQEITNCDNYKNS